MCVGDRVGTMYSRTGCNAARGRDELQRVERGDRKKTREEKLAVLCEDQ